MAALTTYSSVLSTPIGIDHDDADENDDVWRL